MKYKLLIIGIIALVLLSGCIEQLQSSSKWDVEDGSIPEVECSELLSESEIMEITGLVGKFLWERNDALNEKVCVYDFPEIDSEFTNTLSFTVSSINNPVWTEWGGFYNKSKTGFNDEFFGQFEETNNVGSKSFHIVFNQKLENMSAITIVFEDKEKPFAVQVALLYEGATLEIAESIAQKIEAHIR